MTIVRFQPVAYPANKAKKPSTSFHVMQSKLPAVNISRDEKAFYIELATPGMNRSDFDIQLDDNKLIVRGKASGADAGDHFSFIKRDFEKSFLIPDKVDVEKISAKSKDGILRITLPKNDKVVTVTVS
jgi:HSP20 family protein